MANEEPMSLSEFREYMKNRPFPFDKVVEPKRTTGFLGSYGKKHLSQPCTGPECVICAFLESGQVHERA